MPATEIADASVVEELQAMRFGDVLLQVQAALGQGQTWLNDFLNDDVLLTSDLYEVFQAFARLQAPLAEAGE